MYFSVFNIQGQERPSISILTLNYEIYLIGLNVLEDKVRGGKENKQADQINLEFQIVNILKATIQEEARNHF